MGISFGRSIGCGLHAALQNFMQLFIFPCAGKAGMSWLYLSNPCAFFLPIAHGAAGAVGARLSLRPLFGEEQRIGKTRAKTGRENERLCFHVIASAAKQSSFLRRDKKAGLLRRCRSSQ